MLIGVSMITVLLFIIVFTLVFGRVFWACPQTIFMEMVFRRIEYWIEGPAHKQQTADHKKWNTELYIRKIIKHIIFFILSFIIANTFLSYIIGTQELFRIMTDPVQQHITGLLAIVGFTTVFYIVYAFVREIVCTVICPYGRLQSVLLDKTWRT
jgi:polyferredoxin